MKKHEMLAYILQDGCDDFAYTIHGETVIDPRNEEEKSMEEQWKEIFEAEYNI